MKYNFSPGDLVTRKEDRSKPEEFQYTIDCILTKDDAFYCSCHCVQLCDDKGGFIGKTSLGNLEKAGEETR